MYHILRREAEAIILANTFTSQATSQPATTPATRH